MKAFKSALLILSMGCSTVSLAQCVSINCPGDITQYTNGCSAIVNFSEPAGVDVCSTISTTFSYTGAEQTWVVPAGVTSISVDAYGAQGGANWVSNTNFGGRVQADIPVTPGSTIYIYVGQQPNGITGGWNGGGNGESAGQGGGGASDIRIGGNTLNDRVIVAGGGGGAGYWSSQHVVGGPGGDLIGGYGGRVDYATNPGGEPGTQSGSGNGTCVSFNNPACTGGFGYGGAPSGCGCEGYGGGGGWYGGAGSGNCRGGGGGSSYTDPSATNVVHTQGVRTGSGEVVISYANSSSVITSQIAGLAPGASFSEGTTTVTYQALISGVDTAWCSFNVTVIDTVAPLVSTLANVSHCGNTPVNNIPAVASDNCSYTLDYVITGATTGNGSGDASGTVFNTGVSTVTYTATDGSGNTSSASTVVTVTDLPAVSLAAFGQDSICSYYAPIALPAGTPASGVYSGAGVSGNMFDPAQSTLGIANILYTVTDSLGCSNSDTAQIFVDQCLGLEMLSSLELVSVYPNPTNGILFVSLPANLSKADWTLYSTAGKVVRSGRSENNFEIDLGNEESGIYLLKVSADDMNRVFRVEKQ